MKADVEIPIIVMIAALLWTINKTPLVPDMPTNATQGKAPSSDNNTP